MSQLFVITRPTLVPGFQLAGVDAHGMDDVESAQELMQKWISAGEVGLLAIDDGLFVRMDESFIKQLESAVHLPYIVIPGGKPLGEEASQKDRIAALIRQAIGAHITFKSRDESEE